MTTRVKELIIKLYDQYNVRESSTQVRHGSQLPQDSSMKVEENENDDLLLQFMNKFHKYLTSKNDVGNKSEVDRYLIEDAETTNVKFDILNWWKVNSSKFPILAKIARDVLVIPIIMVASESAFSTGGCVLDHFRSSLAPRTVEALVCSQNWLRSKPLNYDSKMDDDEKSYKLDAGKLSNLYHNNALLFFCY
jgi:hypothetical protein